MSPLEDRNVASIINSPPKVLRAGTKSFSNIEAANPKYGADTPFILIARCHVKPDQLDAYLAAANVADAAVKETESGMLHHTFDQDPDDPLAFVWSEVYADDASLLKHLTNPPLVKFVEQHGEMGDDFSIEVYGTLADETKAAFSAAGFPIKYFDTRLGYSRVNEPAADTPFIRARTKSFSNIEPASVAEDEVTNEPAADGATGAATGYGADTPFILIARCHVKPDQLDAYLAAANVADAAVKETESGMLHHTFDQDPDDPLAFVWSEVYADDASLLKHLTNPPLVKFVEQHGEMGDDFSIEVYGTLADETKAAFSATGFPIKYFDTRLGYSRVNEPAAAAESSEA